METRPDEKEAGRATNNLLTALRVCPGEKLSLTKRKTKDEPVFESGKQYKNS